MTDKKLTRKEFLLSALSITAVVALSGVPSTISKKLSFSTSKENNTYGNYSYGGSKKNA